jgi:DNA mismatch endonuclease, patch repair protein
MASVGSRGTGPEVTVRRLLRQFGFKFRVNHPDLPGRPDIVFSKTRKVIFVHGCFWQVHRCRSGMKIPQTNKSYWSAKRERTCARDRSAVARLRDGGWSVLILWECQIKKKDFLLKKLRGFLSD